MMAQMLQFVVASLPLKFGSVQLWVSQWKKSQLLLFKSNLSVLNAMEHFNFCPFKLQLQYHKF